MLAHDISPVAFLLNKIFSKNRPSITTACFANLMSDDQITGFQAIGTSPGSNYIVVVQTANLAASNDANRLQVTIAVK